MTPERKTLYRRAAMTILHFTLDMVGIWLVYFLAFGLRPAGLWGWFWLFAIGIFGRFIVHHLVVLHFRREEKDRVSRALDMLRTGPAIQLQLNEAKNLVLLFGGDHATVSIAHAGDKGHSGPGLYAWFTEYPEEGAVLLSAPHRNDRAKA